MTKTQLFFSLLFVLVVFTVSNQIISAQTLPAKVKSHLNDNYSGWKLFSGARVCNSRAVVSGNFNGDGRNDYAVMFKKGRNGYVVAFLSSGTDYKAHLLETRSSSEMQGVFLSVGRKGTTYGEIIDENFNRRNRKLQFDAPEGGNCEASSYFWIYSNGKFRQAFTSD